MASGFWSPLAIQNQTAGPVITTTGAQSILAGTAKYTFAPNSIQAGSMLRLHADGFISCVVTTPGTARIDIRMGGVASGNVVYDSGPMNLNVVAKSTLPWWFDLYLSCKLSGQFGNFMGLGRFTSEAVIGSPLATVGGSGTILSAVVGGPDTALTTSGTVGANVDFTSALTFDVFFTQTVATGSFGVLQYVLESAAVALA